MSYLINIIIQVNTARIQHITSVHDVCLTRERTAKFMFLKIYKKQKYIAIHSFLNIANVFCQLVHDYYFSNCFFHINWYSIMLCFNQRETIQFLNAFPKLQRINRNSLNNFKVPYNSI